MTAAPCVSLIIPCFNAGGHIAEAIASAAGQSRAPDEIIVVDDGSDDDSAQIVERIGSAVRLLRQENRGAAAARNAGIAASRGSILAFLDADDAWPPDSIAVRLAEMERCGADMVGGRVRQCLVEVGPHVPSGGPDLVGRLAGALLIRRDAFERVGWFDERLRTAETIDWVARAHDKGLHEAHCDAVVLFRRVHGKNMMMTQPGTDQDRLGVLRAAIARRRLVVQ